MGGRHVSSIAVFSLSLGIFVVCVQWGRGKESPGAFKYGAVEGCSRFVISPKSFARQLEAGSVSEYAEFKD
jgi:hypothetical protein